MRMQLCTTQNNVDLLVLLGPLELEVELLLLLHWTNRMSACSGMTTEKRCGFLPCFRWTPYLERGVRLGEHDETRRILTRKHSLR